MSVFKSYDRAVAHAEAEAVARPRFETSEARPAQRQDDEERGGRDDDEASARGKPDLAHGDGESPRRAQGVGVGGEGVLGLGDADGQAAKAALLGGAGQSPAAEKTRAKPLAESTFRCKNAGDCQGVRQLWQK